MSKKNNKFHIGGKFRVMEDFEGSHSYTDEEGQEVTYTYSVPVFHTIYIRKVIYNKPATIVFWSDDTKTVAKCHGDDIYSPETGLVICCLKKLIGGSELKRMLNDWIVEEASTSDEQVVRTIRDARIDCLSKYLKEGLMETF